MTKTEGITPEMLNVETDICRVMRVSPFFMKLVCDKCNKKVNEKTFACFDCGRREKPLKELQLSLQISDNTHSLYVQFNHHDSLFWIGEDGHKIL